MSVLCVLLAAAPLPAADVPILGDTVVPQYRLVKLAVKLPEGAAPIWDVFPETQGSFPDVLEPVPGQLVFSAPPGRYLVKVRVVKPNGMAITIESGQTVVVIGGTPPAPPNPNPNPPTPVPSPVPPELQSKLQAAWATETSATKAQEKKTLADCYRGAAQMAQQPGYVLRIDLVTAAKNYVALNMGDPPNQPKLFKTRRAAGDWLNEKVGTGAQDQLTADLRGRYVTEYTNIAAALDLLQ